MSRICSSKTKNKKKDMLHPRDPSHSMDETGHRHLLLPSTNYLIIVDYTSKFPVVKQLRKIDQRAVITAFKEVFAERGYPDELVSDNGPCYRGEQFREFLKTKGIKHTTSSPYYPPVKWPSRSLRQSSQEHDEESPEVQGTVQ